MSDKQRRNPRQWARPYGLYSDIGANGVTSLDNSTTILGALRLVITNIRVQRYGE